MRITTFRSGKTAEQAREHLFKYLKQVSLVAPKTTVMPDILAPVKGKETIISLVADGAAETVVKARRENPNAKIAVLNFSSFKHPGGGFMTDMLAPAESIVNMYSPPSHDDIDPTPLLAFFFYFFFGMMFSDAGYGLLMVIGTGLAIKLFKPDKEMRNTLKLFQYCGVSTFFWGLIFASFFGDAPATLYNYFTGADITMEQIFPWPTIDPQKDALMLMIISIAFGLVHILVGMGCKFYVCLRQKDYGGAFFDTGLWMLMLIGFAVLAAGMAFGQTLVYVGAGIAIFCAIGLVLTQGRNKKGFGKVIGGLASLYDITGYISDLLSYSRLLALGLTTGVMAQVFNMLSTMFGKSWFGIILLIIVFIIGHAINIGLNALGSYVHTMRLQYVEMFGKFYEGGGKQFKPFKLNSKYIKIQEDKSK